MIIVNLSFLGIFLFIVGIVKLSDWLNEDENTDDIKEDVYRKQSIININERLIRIEKRLQIID
jgi:hypothetical protein